MGDDEVVTVGLLQHVLNLMTSLSCTRQSRLRKSQPTLCCDLRFYVLTFSISFDGASKAVFLHLVERERVRVQLIQWIHAECPQLIGDDGASAKKVMAQVVDLSLVSHPIVFVERFPKLSL